MGNEAPLDARRVRRLLRACWSRASSTLWTSESPARGQCGVTALVTHDHWGGDILKTRTGDAWHFYNRIGGLRHDFTAEQFERAIDYSDLPSDRAEALTDTNEAQYGALAAAFAEALGQDAGRNWTQQTDGATIRSRE